MILPNAVVGHDFIAAAEHWSAKAHRYAFGLFALLFLIVSASGIQVASAYLSAQITLPAFNKSSSAILPAQPIRGPNMMVSAAQQEASVHHIAAQQLTLTFGDKSDQAVTVKPEMIQSWLQIVTDKRQQASYLHVKDSAINTSLTELAKPFVKAPVDQISVTHEDGASVVIAPGQDGVMLGDTSAVSQQIRENLLSAKGLQLNLPLQPQAFQSISAASIDKILEVNVVTKQMWAYDKGVLTRSFPISAGAPETPTPIGQFKIYQKLPIQDMRGFNADGTRYFQPGVRWVNYFLTGGYAVHGNYWRPQSWFGAINSSHGCVSLPDAQAKWIYDWAPIGTTVITHR